MVILSPEDKINRFVEDICCLDAVTNYDSKFNFFRALGLSTNEICHSGFLAWLIDPHGNHGLGSYVLKKLVSQENMNWDSFTVRREWEKIDILAVSETEKYVLCIENKIGTGEHTNQCGRYKATTDIYFPDYRKEFVFLTPNGRRASDPKNWRSMSYTDILEIINGANLEELASDVSIVIRHYMDMLRRDIVGDEELKKICQKIYVKHKGALDLIIANKPHSAEVKETLSQWAEDKAEKGEIQLDLSEKTHMRFTTPAMSKIIPDSEKPDSDWKTKNHYFYEIWVKEPDHDFFMQIALNTTNISMEQRRIFDHIMELRKDVQVAGKGAKYLNPFVVKHQDWYCLKSDDIWICADQMFDELRYFEREIEESLKKIKSENNLK